MKKFFMYVLLVLIVALCGCEQNEIQDECIRILDSEVRKEINFTENERLIITPSIEKVLLNGIENYDVFVLTKSDKTKGYICGYVDEETYEKLCQLKSNFKEFDGGNASNFYSDSFLFMYQLGTSNFIKSISSSLHIDKTINSIQWVCYNDAKSVAKNFDEKRLMSVIECNEYSALNISDNSKQKFNVLEENYDFFEDFHVNEIQMRDYNFNKTLLFNEKNNDQLKSTFLKKQYDLKCMLNSFSIEEINEIEYVNIGTDTRVCNYTKKEYNDVVEQYYNDQITYDEMIEFENNKSDLKQRLKYKTKNINGKENYFFSLENILDLLSINSK